MQYAGVSVGGSYGDWGKSGIQSVNVSGGTPTSYTGAKAGKYWTLGAAYDYANYGASVGYMNSKNGGFKLAANQYSPTKATVELYSFGVDYKIAPGLMPYAEYTHFDVKSKADTAAGVYPSNKGHVILVGTKLTF
jgi:predicted porin